MEVDFNNLRKKAVYAYERLAKTLNASIRTEGDGEFLAPNYNVNNKTPNYWPHVAVRTADIQEAMDDLRGLIGTIAMLHDDEDADVRNVFDEIFPPDHETPTEGPSMTVFNPEEDGE